MMSIKAIFCRALESIRENVVLWAFTCAIFVIVYKAGPLLERVLGRDLHTVFEIISWIVGFIVQIALISLSLGFTRQERPRLRAFFCPVSTFFSYLGGLALFEIAAFALTFLQGLLLFALGLVLHLFLPLVAPWRVPVDVGSSTGEEPLLKVYFVASIITLAVLCQAWLFVRYQFFPFLVVDKGFRPINALKTSSRITQTILGRLVVVDLALLGIHLLLSLLFFILIDSALLGTAFSLPLVLMVLAYLYKNWQGAAWKTPRRPRRGPRFRGLPRDCSGSFSPHSFPWPWGSEPRIWWTVCTGWKGSRRYWRR